MVFDEPCRVAGGGPHILIGIGEIVEDQLIVNLAEIALIFDAAPDSAPLSRLAEGNSFGVIAWERETGAPAQSGLADDGPAHAPR